MKLRHSARSDVGRTRDHNEDDFGIGEGAQIEVDLRKDRFEIGKQLEVGSDRREGGHICASLCLSLDPAPTLAFGLHASRERGEVWSAKEAPRVQG